MISVQDLHVTFNPGTPLERRAVNGIDLTLQEGEFATVIGSNGAGKSTLLAAIAGDVAVERGRIEIGGRDVTRQAPARRAARVARVFQDPLAGSCAALSIEENLALAAMRGARRGLASALNAGRRALLRERVAELGLNLEDRMGDRMGLLSGGQRQALALVMATLAGAEVLLLDEHTAALDPGMAEFVVELTQRLVKAHGLTTLMVTHSMRQALDLGTRTVMLHEGRIVLDITGERRSSMDVDDLVAMFRKVRGGEELDDDSLRIG
ncbi:ABC transporter ATP-binding protein [Chelativorans intermedius]|uniref:ABC transporter ATP-binding protein n=1 Tax=Chelativorans intermedius TaxID=515947 RepID=A0ABV6D2Y4_9HYPH|nr:ABC transporter ATP-binding protein [Chelativorans intermedius]MCT8998501.1 ABC transporter ATP-binding protein [Chelativorans intermedius]